MNSSHEMNERKHKEIKEDQVKRLNAYKTAFEKAAGKK